MSQGILERLETKLDALAAAFEKAGFAAQEIADTANTLAPTPPASNELKTDAGSATPPPPANQTAPTAESTATTTPAVDTDVELDSDGVPWDERIHSSNQKRSKGGEGAWMKRRGVNKDEYSRITAELREKYSGQSGAKQPHVVDGEAQPLKSDAATPPPPAAGNPAPPPPAGGSTPPPPAAPTTPTEQEVPERSKAIEEINQLTKKHGVNYDAIIQYFVDNYNVAGFEEIPADKYPGIVEDCGSWSEIMADIGIKVADIKKVYVNDVSVIEPYIVGAWSGVMLNGEPCANYTDVPFDNLEPVRTAIDALHAQCCQLEG